MSAVTTEATVTCPACGHRASDQMPTHACQFFYRCESCGATLRPRPGDCCVFCSYSDQVCTPKQADEDACCA